MRCDPAGACASAAAPAPARQHRTAPHVSTRMIDSRLIRYESETEHGPLLILPPTSGCTPTYILLVLPASSTSASAKSGSQPAREVTCIEEYGSYAQSAAGMRSSAERRISNPDTTDRCSWAINISICSERRSRILISVSAPASQHKQPSKNHQAHQGRMYVLSTVHYYMRTASCLYLASHRTGFPCYAVYDHTLVQFSSPFG